MKKKLTLVLLFIFSLFISLKYFSKSYRNTDSVFGRISNILNRNNTLELSCLGINKEEINIKWISETGPIKTIVRNGSLASKIGHEYGPNRFKIIVADGIAFNFEQFKTNNWHSHKYKIHVVKDSFKYQIKFEAEGPNLEKIERCFDLDGTPKDELCYME